MHLNHNKYIILLSIIIMHFLTGCPRLFCADQNKCELIATARHWSGFFSNLDAASAH